MVEKDVIHAHFNGMLMLGEGDEIEIIRSRPTTPETSGRLRRRPNPPSPRRRGLREVEKKVA